MCAAFTIKLIILQNKPNQTKPGDQELQPLHTQANKRETSNNRTWSATSMVQIPATRERHGETIKCVALHESYPSKSLSVDAKLDVKCK